VKIYSPQRHRVHRGFVQVAIVRRFSLRPAPVLSSVEGRLGGANSEQKPEEPAKEKRSETRGLGYSLATRSAGFANKELPFGLFHELAKRRRDTVGYAPRF
jgi:hypothetical protein